MPNKDERLSEIEEEIRIAKRALENLKKEALAYNVAEVVALTLYIREQELERGRILESE